MAGSAAPEIHRIGPAPSRRYIASNCVSDEVASFAIDARLVQELRAYLPSRLPAPLCSGTAQQWLQGNVGPPRL